MNDAVMSSSSIEQAMLTLGENARRASRAMMRANSAAKNQALLAMADALAANQDELLAANAKDVAAARANGLEAALLDRLTLSEKTLAHMAEGLRQIAALPDPIGSVTATTVRPNGMRVAQMRVPLGVIGIIYESRPNVTIDAAALCLKSGNAAILRGGSEALHSNVALGRIVQLGLAAAGLPQDAVQVVATADRAAVGKLITMTEHIDVIVPRGGKGLIARLAQEARVPLIKHLDGNCHIYIDAAADPDKAHAIAFNAKTYRYGICGAMETLLVDAVAAVSILPRLAAALTEHGVELRGCPRTLALLPPTPRRPPTKTGAPNTWARSWQSASSIRSTTPSSTSHAGAPATPTRSSPKTCPRPSGSSAKSIPARSTSTCRPALRTASNMAWALKLASRPTACMPAARSAWKA